MSGRRGWYKKVRRDETYVSHAVSLVMDKEDGGGLADASAIYKHAAADVIDDRVARLMLLKSPSADGKTQIFDEDMQQTPNKDQHRQQLRERRPRHWRCTGSVKLPVLVG